MLLFIAPAQTLDFDSPLPDSLPRTTAPQMLDRAGLLMTELQSWTPETLSKTMGLSDALTETTHAFHQKWAVERHRRPHARPAALAFQGTTYLGLQAGTFSKSAWQEAQARLSIFSGLYGVLRPLDRILPYRLEMKIKLQNRTGSSLYPFWKAEITDTLNRALRKNRTDTVLALASNEYVKAIDQTALNGQIITPTFKERREGTLKQISVFSKEMRGRVARHIIRSNLKDVHTLKSLTLNRYRFEPDLSSESEWLFTRASDLA